MKLTKVGLVSFLNSFWILCSFAELIHQSVERSIDLTSQLVKTDIKIHVEDSAGFPIKEYIFTAPENVSYIAARDSSNKYLKIRSEELGNTKQFVVVFLKAAPLQVIHIETVSTKCITPHPDKIDQNEKQLVKYVGNVYFPTPYDTKIQNTDIKLSSSNIVSFSHFKPYMTSSKKLMYGPYENIKGFSKQELVIHFEGQSPFLTVTSLERIIEVSHWGNIAIKEEIMLKHSGAKLKGSFSRYEYQKDGRSGQAAVKSFKTILPASASSIYYRDANGNISTSNMNILRDSVDLELRPRFPLFGGWKTQYTLGYNVPTYEYLYNSDENYELKMRVIDHIFDEMVIDEVVTKIILPEGSSNIELITPYQVTRLPNALYHSYLDTIGRQVISFTKSNLVENHIADFSLKYKYSKVSLFQEPFLLITFINIIFIFTIIFLRLDFAINIPSHRD